MSQVDRMTSQAKPVFHPVSYYESPEQVLNASELSSAEKRMILSSWASDMYVVESQPTLRKVPGIAKTLRLSDILAALRELDEDTDPPPGGAVMRLPPPYVFERAVYKAPRALAGRHAAKQRLRPRVLHSLSRFTREENVQRYRKLLATQLTEHERDYVERRLAEELRPRAGRIAGPTTTPRPSS